MKQSKTGPPGHLSDESKEIFKSLCDEYAISDCAGLRILQAALEARDRQQSCRKTIDEQGLTVIDKAEQIKPHPLLPIERDSRAAFLAALKQLNLDLEPLRDRPGRPPGR